MHLTPGTLATGQGVVRVEDLGPVCAGQLSEFPGRAGGHARSRSAPVLDLAEADRPVDGYETTPPLREQMILRQPGSAFPWSPPRSRRMGLDHTTG